MRPVHLDDLAGLLHFCKAAKVRSSITVTRRGVITLPARLRRALGLRADDQLIAELTPEGLLLRPAVTLPVEVYSPERVREFDAAEAELAAVLQPGAKGRRGAAPRKRPVRRPR